MPRIKAGDVRKMSVEERQAKLTELRAEYVRLKSSSARGTLKKESGKLKHVRRNIARILTVTNESKQAGRAGKATR